MKKSLFIVIASFLAIAPVFAQETDHSSSVPSASTTSLFVTEPYVTNVSDNSMTIICRTADKAICHVEVDGLGDYYYDIDGLHYMGTTHKFLIDGLKPGTSYSYRVVVRRMIDDADVYHFAFAQPHHWHPSWAGQDTTACSCKVCTLDSKAHSCRFSMVNDIHFKDQRYTRLIAAMPKDNDFIFLNGDIVSKSVSIDDVLSHTLDPIAEFAATTPLFYTRGNHEPRGTANFDIKNYFPTTTGMYYYTFRQGPVAFIVLDAGEDKEDNDVEYAGTAAFEKYRKIELEWAEKALNDPAFASAPVKVCIMHIPPYVEKKSRYTQKWAGEVIAPMLVKAGVKLVLCGHKHYHKMLMPGPDGSLLPIAINNKCERMDFKATGRHIHLSFFDEDGLLTHEYKL